MGNPTPTLDYAAPKRNPRLARIWKWSRRAALGLLLVTCLYTAPIAWLYWDWRQEGPARSIIAREKRALQTVRIGPALLGKILPARWAWMRERIVEMSLTGSAVTDEDLRILGRLARLRALWIGGTRVTDAGLAPLARLTRLEALNLGGTSITDAGLVHIAGLANMRELYLDGTKITDQGLAGLKGLGRLRVLWLNDTAVTDAGLAQLQGFAELEELYLGAPRITDAGLVHLHRLEGLKGVYFNGSAVTESGAAELCRVLTKCRTSTGPKPRAITLDGG